MNVLTSIRTRSIFSLVSTITRTGISFATGMLLARWLGPADFGRMAFLLAICLALRGFLDMGSSSAFFTFLSQRARSVAFVRGYYYWLIIQFVVPILIIGLALPSEWVANIWKGEPRGLVVLAFAAAFMQNGAWTAISQHGESQRLSVFVQTIGLLIVIVHAVAMLVLWFFGWLGLYAILAALVLEYGAAGAVALRRYSCGSVSEYANEAEQPAAVFRKYYSYCLPLVPYVIVGFVSDFADRWLLQTYGGRVEQAFYAVGSQFTGIAMIATTSTLSIFWKELAEASYRKNRERMRFLYGRMTRILFFIGAVITGYLIPWTNEIILLVLGGAYSEGTTTLAIMLLYPLHQSLGQIVGTFFYATERVKLYVSVGIVSMTVGLVLTYFVLAPTQATIPGLGLGSQGLAIKMVALQFVTINVFSYIIARIWGWRFEMGFQLAAVVVCVGGGWVTHATIVALVSNGVANIVIQMAIGLFSYIILMAFATFSMPWLVGLTRGELVGYARGLAGVVLQKAK